MLHHPSPRHTLALFAVLAVAGFAAGGCARKESDADLIKKVAALEAAEGKMCRVGLWVDRVTGKVFKVDMLDSSGDPAYDRMVEAQMMQMKIDPPPPVETPMPLVLKVGAQRPGAALTL